MEPKFVHDPTDAIPKGVITITFGERVENHAKMQMIGTLSDKGFTIEELENAKILFENKGATCELIDLNSYLPQKRTVKTNDAKIIFMGYESEKAAILVVRCGVKALGLNPDEMFHENVSYEWDKKALMRNKVVNKRARWNVCISDESQEPAYEEGKGRIINFNDLPITKAVREFLPEYLGDKASRLNAEGNYYYDPKTCYIKAHGDCERKKVIAVRLGESFPLCYQWFQKCVPISERCEIILNHGDIYIMSEKAVGTDWMKSSLVTLRHSAGSEKFTAYKPKKKG